MGGLTPFSAQSKFQLRPVLLVVYLSTVLPHVSTVPNWVILVMALLAIWGILVIRQIIQPIPAFLLGSASIAFTAIIYFQFETLLGPDSATPLLLLLASLKLQEIRKLRDGIIFLFICTLIVMYYLFYSQTLLATLYMLGNLIAIAIAFMILHTPQDKVKQVLRSSPRLVTKDVLFSLPIFLAFFFLFPRFSTPWGRYLTEPKSNIGFSDSMRPGDFAKMASSEDPAFRVTFKNNIKPKAKDLYWRGLIFDQTDGWAWTRHGKTSPLPKDYTEPPRESRLITNTIEYSITLEPKFQKQLFALENTSRLEWTRAEQHNPIHKLYDRVFFTEWPNISRVQYDGVAKELTAPETLTQEQWQFYTKLPNEFSHRARSLAEDLTSESAGIEQKIKSLLNFYSTKGFQYSLNTPEMPDIDSFLFERRVGFCEHFASSFALLLRSINIPARLSIGFQGGDVNEYSNYLLIRDRHAHAWVEAYDSKLGWLRVDPTMSVYSPRITMGAIDNSSLGEHSLLSRAFYSSQMFWDSLNNKYTNLMMNYDFNEQQRLMNIGEKLNLKRYQFFLILVFFSALTLFLLNLRMKKSKKSNESAHQVLFNRLTYKLKDYKVERKTSEGPIGFAERAAELLPDKASLILDLVAQYVVWEYRAQTPSREERAQFIEKLNAF